MSFFSLWRRTEEGPASQERIYREHEISSSLRLKYVPVQQLKPDLLILDITMPGLSGLEASHRIRKLGIRVKVPCAPACCTSSESLSEWWVVKIRNEWLHRHSLLLRRSPNRDGILLIMTSSLRGELRDRQQSEFERSSLNH
jgi:CheY-like chemotaxis protein